MNSGLKRIRPLAAALAIGAATVAVLAAPAAQASNVAWNVSIGVPGLVASFGQAGYYGGGYGGAWAHGPVAYGAVAAPYYPPAPVYGPGAVYAPGAVYGAAAYAPVPYYPPVSYYPPVPYYAPVVSAYAYGYHGHDYHGHDSHGHDSHGHDDHGDHGHVSGPVATPHAWVHANSYIAPPVAVARAGGGNNRW